MNNFSSIIKKIKGLFGNNGVAQNSIALAFVQCLTICTGLAQTMILSRVLTKQEYGTYSQGILVINFCVPFLMLGLSNAITYFSGQKDIDHKKYVNTIFALILGLGVIGGTSISVFSGWLTGYFRNPALNEIMPFVAIRPLLLNLITAFQTLYIANGMSMYIAARNMLIAIAQIIFIIIGAVVFHDILLIFLFLIVMDILQVVFFSYHFGRKKCVIKIWQLDKKIIKTLFHYAIPLALSTMMGTLSIYMDKLIIGRMMSTEEYALYSNMSKELPFSFIVASFTTVVTPVFVRLRAEDNTNLKYIWKDYIEFGYFSTWIICGGAITAAVELLEFLYSAKYSSGLWIFVIYLLVACVRFTYFGMILSISGKTTWIMICTIATLISNLILNILLIGPLGIIGPAIASLIVIFMMGLFQIKLSCKMLHCSLWEIIDLRKIIPLIIEGVFVGGIINIMINRVHMHYLLALIIKYGLFVGIMFLINRKIIIEKLRNLNKT